MPRQVTFEQYGGVEVLQVVEVERPVPGAGQLLVRVKAASINPFDYKLRRGMMEGRFPFSFPSLQGSDVAGVVEEVGAGVTEFAPGDEVFGTTGQRGAQADFALVPVTSALKRPADVSWEVAGSLWVVGTTAYAMRDAASVAEGDLVLVSGASGGVGSVASQLSHLRGATVVGVASERNHEWLRSHGVLPVAYGDGVKQRIEAVAAEVGRPVDAVLDTSGGGYVELGIELGVAPARIDTVADYAAAEKAGAKAIGSAAASTLEVLGELVGLAATGELEIPIHRTFPLDQVRDAYTELEQGHPRGKIVLIP